MRLLVIVLWRKHILHPNTLGNAHSLGLQNLQIIFCGSNEQMVTTLILKLWLSYQVYQTSLKQLYINQFCLHQCLRSCRRKLEYPRKTICSTTSRYVYLTTWLYILQQDYFTIWLSHHMTISPHDYLATW